MIPYLELRLAVAEETDLPVVPTLVVQKILKLDGDNKCRLSF